MDFQTVFYFFNSHMGFKTRVIIFTKTKLNEAINRFTIGIVISRRKLDYLRDLVKTVTIKNYLWSNHRQPIIKQFWPIRLNVFLENSPTSLKTLHIPFHYFQFSALCREGFSKNFKEYEAKKQF